MHLVAISKLLPSGLSTPDREAKAAYIAYEQSIHQLDFFFTYTTKKDEVAFQAFINEPEIIISFKELPESDEESVSELCNIWEIIKN